MRFITLLILLLFFSSASAQPELKHIQFNKNLFNPAWGTYLNKGISGGLGASYLAKKNYWGIDIRIQAALGKKIDIGIEGTRFFWGSLNAINSRQYAFSSQLRYYFIDKRFAPYALAGICHYVSSVQTSYNNGYYTVNDSKTYFTLGAGFKYEFMPGYHLYSDIRMITADPILFYLTLGVEVSLWQYPIKKKARKESGTKMSDEI